MMCLMVVLGCQQKIRITLKVTGTVQDTMENGDQITITYGDNNVQRLTLEIQTLK